MEVREKKKRKEKEEWPAGGKEGLNLWSNLVKTGSTLFNDRRGRDSEYTRSAWDVLKVSCLHKNHAADEGGYTRTVFHTRGRLFEYTLSAWDVLKPSVFEE